MPAQFGMGKTKGRVAIAWKKDPKVMDRWLIEIGDIECFVEKDYREQWMFGYIVTLKELQPRVEEFKLRATTKQDAFDEASARFIGLMSDWAEDMWHQWQKR